MGEDPLGELARIERERRKSEALAHRVRELKRTALGGCQACSEFAPGRRAFFIDEEFGETIDTWRPSPLSLERYHDLYPHDREIDWPSVNREFSTEWIRRWVRVVNPLRELDAIEAGTLERVRAMTSADARHRAMHGVFCDVLAGTEIEASALRLAEIRATFVPSLAELEKIGGWDPRARFALGGYFLWLRPQLEQLWASPQPPQPAETGDVPLTLQQRRFRDLFLELDPGEPLVGSAVCERYRERWIDAIDEAAFRRRIVPELKKLGLRNARRRGYYFPRDAVARREHAD